MRGGRAASRQPTTYRRGYIADMLYQVPAHPPTDLTVFIPDVPLTLD